jgi:hypothetical protein
MAGPRSSDPANELASDQVPGFADAPHTSDVSEHDAAFVVVGQIENHIRAARRRIAPVRESTGGEVTAPNPVIGQIVRPCALMINRNPMPQWIRLAYGRPAVSG